MTSPQVFLILALVSLGAADPDPWFRPNTDPGLVRNASSTKAVCSCEYNDVNGCEAACVAAGCSPAYWAMKPKPWTTSCECDCYCATRPYSAADEYCQVCNVNIFTGTDCMIAAYSSVACVASNEEFCTGYGNIVGAVAGG